MDLFNGVMHWIHSLDSFNGFNHWSRSLDSFTGFIQRIHSMDSHNGFIQRSVLGSSWVALGSFGVLLGCLSLDSFNGVDSLWASDAESVELSSLFCSPGNLPVALRAESVELSTLFGLQMLKV